MGNYQFTKKDSKRGKGGGDKKKSKKQISPYLSIITVIKINFYNQKTQMSLMDEK